jgi:hypothetical protein
MLPQIANSPSNKVWIVPTELTQALKGIGNALGGGSDGTGTWTPGPMGDEDLGGLGATKLEDPNAALRRARAEAADAVADAERTRRMAPSAPMPTPMPSQTPPAVPFTPPEELG